MLDRPARGSRAGWRAAAVVGALAASFAVQEAAAQDGAAPDAPQPADRKVEEIVVTASPLERKGDELAVPLEILKRSEIVDRGGATLGEALRGEPGVTNNSFAVGASRPVIRGQDADRVKVLENGGGTGDVSTLSADHGVPINPLAVRRLEVVRGPATLRYGGGAIGGVVNAITGRIPGEPIGRALSSEIYSAYGTGADERNLAGQLEGDLGSFSWHLDGLGVQAHNYDIPGSPGQQSETAARTVSVAGGGAWIGEHVRTGLSVSRFRSDYGIPAPEDPLSPSTISLEQDRYEYELDVTPGGDWIDQLRVRAGRTEYFHEEIVHDKLAHIAPTGASFDNEEREVRTELVHQALAGFTGALGLQYQDRDFFAGGEGGDLLPPADSKTYAVYLFESRDLLDRLKLDLAGRIERTRVNGSTQGVAFGRIFHPLSASASLLYSLTDVWSLGLTLTSAQRALEPFELYSQGAHDAPGTFEIGNPRASVEGSRTVDFQVRGGSGPLSGQLNLFVTDYKNFTFGRLTGTSRDEDGTTFTDLSGGLKDLIYTQDDARFKGGELKLRWDLFKLGPGGLGLELQSDYVRAELSNDNVPRIPPFRWGAGVVYDGDQMTARLGFMHNDSQNETAPFETRTAGYTSVDGSVRLRVAGSAERPIDLTLSGRNLLDARGRNAVSFKKDDVLLPGRDIRVGVQMQF